LFEETPLGAGRNQYIHSFFHPASNQATTAEQSKAQHNSTQQTWGNRLDNYTVCTLLDALAADS
jgi:hypothetical protein